MLQSGNKQYRNLQEQVFKNMKDIQDIMDGTTVLAEFGIKVVGQVESAAQLPDPSTYTGEFGDAYVAGASEPYDYYIYTRAFEGDETPQWFYLGKFPVPGPQGESAGFGVVSASAKSGSVVSASVTVSGPDTAKNMHFDFTIPSAGGAGASEWGQITGTLSNQTDLQSALDAKQAVISDLSTIRSGAALGSTAVQPGTLSTELSTKQDTISDLDTIRTGAELGSTAVQPSTLSTELANKQDTLVSGTNIKTINGNSILGSGDITIQGGSDIDNKTIIENESSGKIETAVGGWKEVIVHPASEGLDTGSVSYNSGSGDFDKYDTTIATNIYNLMTGSEARDFATITCTSDGGNNFTIKLTGLKSAQYNDDKWNSTNDNFEGIDQNGNAGWSVQIYVVKSSGRIHVWFSSQQETINSITNIDFGKGPQYTETIYHKIDSNYLPEDIFDITDIPQGNNLTDEQIEKFKKSTILKYGDNYLYKTYQSDSNISYKNDEQSGFYTSTDSFNLTNKHLEIQPQDKYMGESYTNSYEIKYDNTKLIGLGVNRDKLSIVLDGGYDGSKFNLSASDFTLDNDHYVCNNSKFLESTKNFLTWMIKNYQSGSSLSYFWSSGNSNSIWIDMSTSDETEESSGRTIRTGTVTSSELLNSVVKIYTDTNEVKSCNIIYTQEFIDFLTNNNINGFKTDNPEATGLIKKISPKFIPEEGYTNLAVSNQIKIGNTTLNETQLQSLLNLLNK